MRLRSNRIIGNMSEVIERDLICQALGLNVTCELTNEQLIEKIRLMNLASSSSDSSTDSRNTESARNENEKEQSSEHDSLRKFLAEFKIELPVFYGQPERENAFEFLDKLSLLQEEKELTDDQVLKHVLPRCLLSPLARGAMLSFVFRWLPGGGVQGQNPSNPGFRQVVISVVVVCM